MIQFSEKSLENKDSIALLLAQADKEWNKRKELYNRYRRKTDNSDIVDTQDSNIQVAFEYYITNMTTGYFAGKEPIYSVNKVVDEEKKNIITNVLGRIFKKNNEEELQALIDYIRAYNDDGAEFRDLAFDYFCTSACYEILYENTDNEIVYTRLSPLNTIAIYDYCIPSNLIGILRRLQVVVDADGTKRETIELLDKTGKHYYYGNADDGYFENTNEMQVQKWDDIPVIAIENEDGLSCFELVINLVNAYERVIQNSRNTFQYNDEAKLGISGYMPENNLTTTDSDGNIIPNPARAVEDRMILNAKTLYFNDGGSAGWIEKNVQDSALQNHKKTLIDLICLVSGVPNMTDLGFTQADNSSALDKKFFSLEQNITKADKSFTKGFLRRWELIINKINKKKNKDYDFRDVRVELIRNLPTDKLTETQRALQLRGLLSDGTIIDMLPDDLNSDSELAKINEQNEQAVEENLKRMKTLGEANKNGELETEQETPQEQIQPQEEVVEDENTL